MANGSFLGACAAVVASLICSTTTEAARPTGLFSDNAVLQQGISVPVWGTADDGEKVTVRFQGQTVSTVACDGRWMVRLKPLKAGGPFDMVISGANTVELKNILVGEVWVCGGQSNMQFGLVGSDGGSEAVAASRDPMMRLLSVPVEPSVTPKADVESKWAECGPDTSAYFSAVGFYFGRELRKALNVPVGLINASCGGTTVEAWTPKRVQPDVGWAYHRWTHSEPEERQATNHASAMYNGMIAPLIPYGVRGAIWYQGESNAEWASLYRERFPRMIRGWREDWGEGEFPFLFAQLAPYMRIVDKPEESSWAELREAQFLTSRNCPNTAVAATVDVGDPNDVHPTRKEPVGVRLALAARAKVYGQRVAWQSPTYKSMKIDGDRIVVSFDGVGKGLEARGGKLTGFAVAGEDRKFFNAEACITGTGKVTVHSAKVSRPIAVRLGWANCPVVNLYNIDGLPALPFRTDDFPMVTASKQPGR